MKTKFNQTINNLNQVEKTRDSIGKEAFDSLSDQDQQTHIPLHTLAELLVDIFIAKEKKKTKSSQERVY